jgi:PAS domain S-box-containing protein
MGDTADPIRVRHVDDDPAFVELTARLLEREDDRLEVTGVTGAEARLDAFEAEPFDCVVSDYDMPGTDGLAFLEAIRERDEAVPFVLFTGEGNERVAGEAISAGVTDYLQKGAGDDQYAVLANRVTNAVAAYRARRRAARQERINTLIRDVNRRLVNAGSVEGIERAVCETITDSEPYRFAWIGEPDPESVEVVPRASGGDGDQYLERVIVYHDDRPRGWGPVGMAIRTREAQSVRNIPEDPSFEPWHDVAAEFGFESVVVLPLFRGELLHGILAIYADHPDAFTDVERAVLAELAGTIGRAFEGAHVRRRLRNRERDDVDATEQHYRAIAESLPNGAIALFDTDMCYTLVGGAVFDELDTSPVEMKGSPLREAHSEPYAERYLRHYRAALEGERRSFEFEYGDRTFRAHVVPVRDDAGTVVAGLGLTQDVTEERARERELERQNERLEALASVVSHDLRNSLNVASGRLEIAATECESEHLDAIERALERMETLIEDLLALAREGRAAIDVEPVALAEVMREAWRSVETVGARRVLETDRVVRADRGRLQQLFENLVRNSVEHGSTGGRAPPDDVGEGFDGRPSGGGDAVERAAASDPSPLDGSTGHGPATTTVRLGALEDGFYIEDDGAGIPPERREAVLEPGYSTDPEGTGFGLNTVRRIAEEHGWSLSITEGTDGGARFEVTGVEFER